MIRSLILSAVFLCTVLHASALPLNPRKPIVLMKSPSTIVVDGIIEDAWQSADSTTQFFQLQPFYGKPPSRMTVAKVLATEEALYCLLVCYDDPANVQRITGKLDEFGGDVVSIMLDTFGDKRTAYKFAVSASGVRNDCRLLDDARNRDYSWDGVWFSAANVYDWGFAVEMEIPFRSIQYDENLHTWGLDFDRWIPALNEDLYWCEYEENEGQRISKFGTLELNGNRPTVKGLNLEIYPVAATRASFIREGVYSVRPDAGIDVFYNPSQMLTFQLTGNPDFAQIEADPFNFNISRYESYFDERRPFFTQGNEIFLPAGRDRSSGFYRPLELFYSRRIGKILPDGTEVPLLLGTKAFGRIENWEYGGFLAMTDATAYNDDDERRTEPRALFGSARVKRQILDNSSVGVLMVGKRTAQDLYGVIDIDGAFRATDWQLSYQLARSVKNEEGDYAASLGLLTFKETWALGVRGRFIGENFDISQVGYVPWQGTSELTAFGGPRWYFEDGYLRQLMIYTGLSATYEAADLYTDRSAVLGINFQFRTNWGMEVTLIKGHAKDAGILYPSTEIDFSSWFNVSPKWNANLNGGYAKTYNFRRDYLSHYSWVYSSVSWRALDELSVGTTANFFVEGDREGGVEDVTINARPYVSVTPVNDLSMRLYIDNVFVRSTSHVEQVVVGFLFAYNFLPKSWIYFAVNEVQDRSDEYDARGLLRPNRLHVADRVAVFKLKYLYYM